MGGGVNITPYEPPQALLAVRTWLWWSTRACRAVRRLGSSTSAILAAISSERAAHLPLATTDPRSQARGGGLVRNRAAGSQSTDAREKGYPMCAHEASQWEVCTLGRWRANGCADLNVRCTQLIEGSLNGGTPLNGGRGGQSGPELSLGLWLRQEVVVGAHSGEVVGGNDVCGLAVVRTQKGHLESYRVVHRTGTLLLASMFISLHTNSDCCAWVM